MANEKPITMENYYSKLSNRILKQLDQFAASLMYNFGHTQQHVQRVQTIADACWTIRREYALLSAELLQEWKDKHGL